MDLKDLSRLRVVAEQAAATGARIVAARAGHGEPVTSKGPGDYVTDVDRKSEAAIRSFLAGATPDIPVVAEEGGDVVGMAYAEPRVPSRFSDERALEISGVVVRADHRGRGVGQALVEEIALFADEIGIGWMELKTFWPNETAMGFWRALGFTPRVVQLTARAEDVARHAAARDAAVS